MSVSASGTNIETQTYSDCLLLRLPRAWKPMKSASPRTLVSPEQFSPPGALDKVDRLESAQVALDADVQMSDGKMVHEIGNGNTRER